MRNRVARDAISDLSVEGQALVRVAERRHPVGGDADEVADHLEIRVVAVALRAAREVYRVHVAGDDVALARRIAADAEHVRFRRIVRAEERQALIVRQRGLTGDVGADQVAAHGDVRGPPVESGGESNARADVSGDQVARRGRRAADGESGSAEGEDAALAVGGRGEPVRRRAQIVAGDDDAGDGVRRF